MSSNHGPGNKAPSGLKLSSGLGLCLIGIFSEIKAKLYDSKRWKSILMSVLYYVCFGGYHFIYPDKLDFFFLMQINFCHWFWIKNKIKIIFLFIILNKKSHKECYYCRKRPIMYLLRIYLETGDSSIKWFSHRELGGLIPSIIILSG